MATPASVYTDRAQQLQDQRWKDQRDVQLTPLQESLRADQTRLALYANPDDPTKPLAGKEDQYNSTLNRMTQTIGQMRSLYGQKPQEPNPVEAALGNVADRLHITNHLKNHVAQARADAEAKYQGQNQQMAAETGVGALPFAMTPEGQKAAYLRQTQLDVANARGTMKEYQSPDGKERNWFRPGSEPSGWQAAQSGSKGYIRQSNHVLTPQNAIGLMHGVGVQFPKQDGTIWTADEIGKFPQGIVLAGFLEGDKTFYAPFDQRTKTANIGNMVVQLPEAGEITPNTENPLGVSRVGTTTTQTAPGGGQVVTQTSTPNTVGPSGTTTPSRSAMHSGPVHRQLQGHAALGRGESILPDIQNMTPRNAEMARKAQPAVTALLGLYGDPKNPDAPSMIEFAPLANDPHAQLVLGEAFKLLDQQMGEISDPGIIQTLATSAGWANFRAQAEASAQQATGTQMTQQEREYFDSAIASMADIIGSRSATGQSPARFSVRAIQNELPLIGLSGTPDKESYLTKMQTIGRQVRVGLNAMPDNSRAMAWLTTQENKIAKEKNQKQGKPIVQHSASTGKYRYSLDGGSTWHPGKPPNQ